MFKSVLLFTFLVNSAFGLKTIDNGVIQENEGFYIHSASGLLRENASSSDENALKFGYSENKMRLKFDEKNNKFTSLDSGKELCIVDTYIKSYEFKLCNDEDIAIPHEIEFYEQSSDSVYQIRLIVDNSVYYLSNSVSTFAFTSNSSNSRNVAFMSLNLYQDGVVEDVNGNKVRFNETFKLKDAETGKYFYGPLSNVLSTNETGDSYKFMDSPGAGRNNVFSTSIGAWGYLKNMHIAPSTTVSYDFAQFYINTGNGLLMYTYYDEKLHFLIYDKPNNAYLLSPAGTDLPIVKLVFEKQ